MATEIGRELAALRRLTPAQLREKYAAVFGEATVTKNRTWLVRRIAWRLLGEMLKDPTRAEREQNWSGDITSTRSVGGRAHN